MIGNFTIRQGSTLPWLDVQITQDGFVDMNLEAPKLQGCGEGCGDKDNIVDLTGAQVRFRLFKCGRTPSQVALTGTAEIVDAACGTVRYKWAPGDLPCACLFYGQFEIRMPDNTLLLWPFAKEQLTIEVL